MLYLLTCDEIDIIYYYYEYWIMCNPYCVFFKNEKQQQQHRE